MIEERKEDFGCFALGTPGEIVGPWWNPPKGRPRKEASFVENAVVSGEKKSKEVLMQESAGAELVSRLDEYGVPFDTLKSARRYGLAIMLKSYIPNVACDELVCDENYECVALIQIGNDGIDSRRVLKTGATSIAGVIGGACYRVHTDRESGIAFIELSTVCIDASFQGLGLGSKLMHYLESRAIEEHGAYRILAYADNLAFAFFRRQGFSRTVTTPFAVWKPRIVDYSLGAVIAEKVLDRTKDMGLEANRLPKKNLQYDKTLNSASADALNETTLSGDTDGEVLLQENNKNASRALATGVRRCTSGLSNCYCRSGRTRAIVRYDIDTGAVLEEYCSTSDAARKLGVSGPQITHVLSGHAEDAKGHKFRYAAEVPWIRSGGARQIVEIDPATGSIKKEYGSAAEAARATGLSNSQIGMVCSGKIDDVDGRIFRFNDARVYPCAICGTDHDGANLLLCDGLDGRCVSTAHVGCLGLTAVPESDWFCQSCISRGEHKRDKKLSHEANIAYLAAKRQLSGRRPSSSGTKRAKKTNSTSRPAPKKIKAIPPSDRPRRSKRTPPKPLREAQDLDDDHENDLIRPVSRTKTKPTALAIKTNTSPPKKAKPILRESEDEEGDFDDDSEVFADDDDNDDDWNDSPRRKKNAEQSKAVTASYADKPVEANYDDCAVCAFGGDLLCCDFCPEAFHPKCAGLHRIPKGLWACPVCVSKGIHSKKQSRSTKKRTRIS